MTGPEEVQATDETATRGAQSAGPATPVDRERLLALADIGAAVVAGTGRSAGLLDYIARRAAEVLGADAVIMRLLDPGGEWLERVAGHNLGSEFAVQTHRLRVEGSMAAQALQGRRAVVVSDLAVLPATGHRRNLRHQGFVSLVIIPLIGRDGPVGTLHVLSRAAWTFPPDEHPVALALANFAAIAIEGGRLSAETAQRLAEMETLLTIGRTVGEGLGVAEIARRATRQMVRLLGADLGGVWLSGEDRDRLTPLAGYRVPRDLFAAPFYRSDPIVDELSRRRVPVASMHSAEEPWFDLPLLNGLGHRSVVAVPLLSKDAMLGVFLVVWLAKPHRFSAEELRLLDGIAAMTAVAIQNARLLEAERESRRRLDAETHARLREAELFGGVVRAINESLDLNTVLQRVTDAARELCASDIARIALRDGDAVVLRYCSGSPRDLIGRRVDPGRGLGGKALLTRTPQRTALYAADETITKEHLPVIIEEGSRAVMAVPICESTRVEGLVYVSRRDDRAFTDADEAMLVRLAEHAAVAIRNAGRYAESEERRGTAEALADVGQTLSQSLDPEEVARRVVESVQALIAAAVAAVYRLDEETGALRLVAGMAGEPGDGAPAAAEAAMAALAVRDGEPVAVADVAHDPRVAVDTAWTARVGAVTHRAILALPLTVAGRVIGALTVRGATGRVFTDEEVRIVGAFAGQAATALENARLYEGVNRARDEVSVLVGLGRELGQTMDLSQVLGLILQQAVVLGEADAGYVAVTQADGTAHVMATMGTAAAQFEGALIRPGGTVGGQVVATGQVGRRPGVLVMPVKLAARLVGIVWLARDDGRDFEPSVESRLHALAMSWAIALENGRLYQEITEGRAELERANAALAQTLRFQSEFLANTTHELRTPLCSIMSLLNAVTEGLCDGEEEAAQFIAQARSNAAELLELITNILDMTRLEAGGLVVEREAVDLQTLFDEVAVLVGGEAARRREVRLVFHPPDPAYPTVPADPLRLRQVLVNLVGNGLKFTERGEVSVRAVPRPEQGFVTLEVADTGVGIPLERQARIFDKFVQADGSTTRKYGGTGLGLAICKRLVELMGGIITLESAGEGRGTRVMVSLPLAEAPAPADAPPVEPGITGPNERPLVLVVDDEPAIRGAVTEMLHLDGYQTAQAATADEALQAARRLRPALVIADCALPSTETAEVRTGVDLVAALQVLPGGAIPAILLTGAAWDTARMLGRLDPPPPVPIVEKPVDFSLLRATVARYVARNALVVTA